MTVKCASCGRVIPDGETAIGFRGTKKYERFKYTCRDCSKRDLDVLKRRLGLSAFRNI